MLLVAVTRVAFVSKLKNTDGKQRQDMEINVFDAGARVNICRSDCVEI